MNDEIEEPVDAEEITKESCENPYNIDAETNFRPEAPVADARDDTATHRTPTYLKHNGNIHGNIDKDDNMTCRTIYEAIDEPYFKEVTIFPKEFLGHFIKKIKHATK